MKTTALCLIDPSYMAHLFATFVSHAQHKPPCSWPLLFRIDKISRNGRVFQSLLFLNSGVYAQGLTTVLIS